MAIGTPVLGGTANATGAGTLSVAYPASVAAGNYLILFISSYGTASTPSGWSVLGSYSSTTQNFRVFGKVAVGGETGSVSSTLNEGATAVMFRVPGVDTTTPVDVGGTSQGSATSAATRVYPSVTSVTAGALLLTCHASDSSSQTHTGSGTELIDFAVPTALNNAGAVYYETLAGAGASGTRTVTLAAARASSGVMFALRPAVTGPVKAVGGSITGSADIARAPSKRAVGSSTFAGSYVRSGLARALFGSSTPAGVKIGRLPRTVGGVVASTAVTQRGYPRSVAGSLAPAGTVVKQSAGRFLYATISGVGVIRKAPARLLSGSGSAFGVIVRAPRRFMVGLIPSSGNPHQLGIRFRTFAGAVASSGVVRRAAGKLLAGAATPTAPPPKRTGSKRLAAVIATTASRVLQSLLRVFGPAGTATVTIGTAVDVDLSSYLYHRAQMFLEITTEGVGSLDRAVFASLLSGSTLVGELHRTVMSAEMTSGNWYAAFEGAPVYVDAGTAVWSSGSDFSGFAVRTGSSSITSGSQFVAVGNVIPASSSTAIMFSGSTVTADAAIAPKTYVAYADMLSGSGFGSQASVSPAGVYTDIYQETY